MSAPRLGVLTGVHGVHAVAPLLRALSDRCDVAAWEPGVRFDCVLATSWRAPRLREATRDAGEQLVLWDDPADPAPAAVRAGSTISVFVPSPCVDAREHRVVPPFLRARWRDRFAIDVPVVPPPHLTWRQRRSFLSLCPAVVAHGTIALEALAFATPLVTDAATAAMLGARDSVHLLVCDSSPAAAASLATELGGDHRLGAALGRAGRRLVEDRHDVSRIALDVSEALGWPSPGGRVAARLVGLPTPPLARPITRAEARLGELGVA